MVSLQRSLKLHDRFDTCVFTFALPQRLLTDQSSNVYTNDFTYGCHKWTAIFSLDDTHFGCFLKLQSICDGMKCRVDFSYTLLNREHFTRNETFTEKTCIYTLNSTQHGRKGFIGLNDLFKRGFAQGTESYLLELELKNIVCTFECYISLPREVNSRYIGEIRLESPYFTYGLSDWNITIFQKEGSSEKSLTSLQLHRHTGFDHICNIRYYVSIGDTHSFQSEELDHLVDTSGYGDIYTVNGSLHKLSAGRSSLKVKVTLVSMVTVSEVYLNVNKRKTQAHLYDRDKQAW